jgi:hypothetical protein
LWNGFFCFQKCKKKINFNENYAVIMQFFRE